MDMYSTFSSYREANLIDVMESMQVCCACGSSWYMATHILLHGQWQVLANIIGAARNFCESWTLSSIKWHL